MSTANLFYGYDGALTEPSPNPVNQVAARAGMRSVGLVCVVVMGCSQTHGRLKLQSHVSEWRLSGKSTRRILPPRG